MLMRVRCAIGGCASGLANFAKPGGLAKLSLLWHQRVLFGNYSLPSTHNACPIGLGGVVIVCLADTLHSDLSLLCLGVTATVGVLDAVLRPPADDLGRPRVSAQYFRSMPSGQTPR